MLLRSALGKILAGQVRLLFCEEPQHALMRARYGTLPQDGADPERPYIAITWRELPALREQLSFVLLRFAEMSQALFERWSSPASAAPEVPGLLNWRTAASRLCAAGEAPLVKNCAPAFQLRQLGLTLGRELTVLLTTERFAQRPTALAGLVRTAEWIAKATDARVALLMPTLWRGHPELQRIAYGELSLDEPSGLQSSKAAHGRQKRDCEISLWPVAGQPHGLSPGEQLLALAVHADAQLRSCFLFNQRLLTALGTHYCVDLLWPTGRVVVEVDGYQYHSDRDSFAADRQRDYELLLSGYRVLRLTHDEIWFDLPGAVNKIRNVIGFAAEHVIKEAP
jgi:very-short-patch-repair endonuclease